jgi:phospholipid/cholesterol/gamma-HCH transport system permease protein
MNQQGAGITSAITAPILSLLTFIGEVAILLGDSVKRLVTSRFEFKEFLQQMVTVGYQSIPIVALTGFFSGAVLSLYLSQFLSQYGSTGFVGATVVLSMTREIGPVLAGIMAAARCGSAMAAQIGTMSVTEQVDALRMLSVHPINYLVIPRMAASAVMLPVLGLVCMWAGSYGGYLVSGTEGVSGGTYMSSIQQFVKPGDILSGLLKTPVFGIIVALVSCQQGLRTKNGAVGVGVSTTGAVVISIILIYAANFVLAKLLVNM